MYRVCFCSTFFGWCHFFLHCFLSFQLSSRAFMYFSTIAWGFLLRVSRFLFTRLRFFILALLASVALTASMNMNAVANNREICFNIVVCKFSDSFMEAADRQNPADVMKVSIECMCLSQKHRAISGDIDACHTAANSY